ncbi:GTPase ObgE [Spirochaetota bacterium]
MSKFTDTINIQIRSGNGGPGAVSFRREKYIPKGGPDGGDGGKGGNVYIQCDRSQYNLSHFFKDRLYSADNGKHGQGRNMNGKDGKDLVIKVPPGTEVVVTETGEVLADIIEDNQRELIAEGGIGGKGNEFFKSSTNQSPRFSQDGMPGEEIVITLNLKLIADIGLVGLPNAGKSTLLSKITNAKPKIANYPFTTLTPNLGVIQNNDGSIYKIADIPGIIEGAHKGMGLGLSFLKHIERVKVILYLIDLAESDLHYNFELLKSELVSYNESLLNNPYYIVLTKVDLMDDEELKEKLSIFKDENVITISSVTGQNIDKLINILDEFMSSK